MWIPQGGICNKTRHHCDMSSGLGHDQNSASGSTERDKDHSLQISRKCKEANREVSEIHALAGNTTAAKTLKLIQNAEYMLKVWKKIVHADKKKDKGSISSLQVPVIWPDPWCDISEMTLMDNPKNQVTGKLLNFPKI
eukprot:1947880-Ditylum_brightwellii.AAC.1